MECVASVEDAVGIRIQIQLDPHSGHPLLRADVDQPVVVRVVPHPVAQAIVERCEPEVHGGVGGRAGRLRDGVVVLRSGTARGQRHHVARDLSRSRANAVVVVVRVRVRVARVGRIRRVARAGVARRRGDLHHIVACGQPAEFI